MIEVLRVSISNGLEEHVEMAEREVEKTKPQVRQEYERQIATAQEECNAFLEELREIEV